MSADVIRPEFIAAMRHEIEANAYKGDWTKFRIGRTGAEAWLGEHVTKLLAAVAAMDREAVREHAADVANIAMKIDECCGVKQDDTTPAPTPRTDDASDTEILNWIEDNASKVGIKPDWIGTDAETGVLYFEKTDIRKRVIKLMNQ